MVTVEQARELVMSAALALALAERGEPGYPVGSKWHEARVRYCRGELAVASRELTTAVEANPRELPIGW